MFIYTLPQLVVNKLLIMGIVWETDTCSIATILYISIVVNSVLTALLIDIV